MSAIFNFAGFSLDAPSLASNSSFPVLECYRSRTSILIFTSFSVTNAVLLLPLSALVLYLGYQRWRQQRTTAAAATSHSDVFTFHLVAMEMIAIGASFFFIVGMYADLPVVLRMSLDVFTTTWSVKVHFHTLTCVERYLAVVHPVTYLHQKNSGGVKTRNISIAIVWVLFVVKTIRPNVILYFCFGAFAFVVVCFCSFSVLCALRHPGPGAESRDGEPVHQMKRRAFHTITTITGALFLCFGGMVVCNAVKVSLIMSNAVGCAVMTSGSWFSLPSSLVLPLLFLHRAGKLPGCSSGSG